MYVWGLVCVCVCICVIMCACLCVLEGVYEGMCLCAGVCVSVCGVGLCVCVYASVSAHVCVTTAWFQKAEASLTEDPERDFVPWTPRFII